MNLREPTARIAPHSMLVIPCYNEAARLVDGDLLSLLHDDGVELLFVDDGSTDGTLAHLRQLESDHQGRIHVLALAHNRGKAEAVREGLRAALDREAAFVGYLDADLATPPSEVLRLLRVLCDSDAEAILGSRVALLGTDIERSMVRHYLGRVFATAASIILRAAVYDTQCGAKVFRNTAALRAALADPFISRWAFDVELLGRLFTGTAKTPALPRSAIREEPLLIWHDIPGSKLGPAHMARTLTDLAKIERDLGRRRALASAD
jgi:glycosyltransferase involved in cell wall biosynthesis